MGFEVGDVAAVKYSVLATLGVGERAGVCRVGVRQGIIERRGDGRVCVGLGVFGEVELVPVVGHDFVVGLLECAPGEVGGLLCGGL